MVQKRMEGILLIIAAFSVLLIRDPIRYLKRRKQQKAYGPKYHDLKAKPFMVIISDNLWLIGSSVLLFLLQILLVLTSG